jgi:hypothetical protein
MFLFDGVETKKLGMNMHAGLDSVAFAALASYKVSKTAWRDSTGPEIPKTIQSWGEVRCAPALITSLTIH